MNDRSIEELAKSLDDRLTERYGPVLGSGKLATVLGYSTANAFRQAIARKTVPVPIFRMPNRRGHFALARDVALWLATQRQSAFSASDK